MPPPYLRLDELRKLVRSGRSGSVADFVGRALHNRSVAMLSSEVAEIAEVIGGLTRQAREKLYEEGYPSVSPDTEAQKKMPKRDRERAEHLAVLLTIEGNALARAGDTEALACAEESIGWARLAGSAALEAEGWQTVADIHGIFMRLPDIFDPQHRALEAARRSNDPCLIIEVLVNLALVFIMRGRPIEAEEQINEAMPLAEGLSEPDATRYRTKLLMTRGRIETIRRNGEGMLTNYREALRLVDRTRDPHDYMLILSDLGTAYATYGDEQNNIECQRQMIATAEQHGDLDITAWGYYGIGEAFFRLKDYEQAEKAFDLSLRFSPSHATQPRLYVTMMRAEICGRVEKPEEGLEHCRTILSTITEQSAPHIAARVLLQTGLLENALKNFKAAERAYRQAIDVGERYGVADRVANAQLHLARVLRVLKREKEAEEMVRKVLNIEIRDIGDEITIADACGILSEIAEKQENLREALHYSRESNTRRQSVTERKTEESIQKARVLAEVDRLEREAELEREQRRRTEQDLAQAVLALSGKNELLDKVEGQLRRALAGITSEKAREITLSVKNALLQIDTKPSDGGNALGYLKTIDADFTARLRAHYPDLTRKQERLCGLIRAGMTSQEIATILGLSYEGLRAQRKRLRKKLGLEAEGNLENLISTL